MDNLPYGSNSGISLFAKIKERLSGIPTYLLAFFAVLIATLILGAFYILLSPNISLKDLLNKVKKPEEEKIENIWSAYTTTPPPIAGGKQLYRISGGMPDLPLITEVIIDPQDAKKDQNQTVTVKANGPTAIKEVIVVLRLDDENNFEYKLAQSSGTPTNGEWKGNWKFPHTYNKTYRLNIKARNENNLGNMATITIR
ncbi:MAG: hypothetical protein UX88_C0006G0012 [Candidatus Woesebacteria bacterium GW2011_GWC2_47_16]|uniref:Uncharacterized protein n=9 Tax=Candidatus Woeseibacteriota TaxID=1752722 RepID=A0A0G1QSZ3_9BACT|nr:MAG: hypothetical protein UX03_C0014G0003 [Candidatus Woesebacteria bacterium GW2011_GWE1_45_18]KKU24377.1 MAG: hypothetical protein UX34_C0007G0030 [Candidatus Woesebacteria bacterium GW2011_GWF1_46_13]KKU48096.1 MAG: hypothetical protein UX67_C0023G0002 [Candidatus Woesebacteria bacterium GW2011_GWF2_46_8]KKU65083.1 MAG: hypothetical protein UX88_C0006G0012 [Candidatus Woesebacteria bacterium GW2011_GWC2_47_16]KKU70908.1 MAG: hypothetical protein UX95_C0010G0004 [Candidatus Woesebacteria b